MNGQTLTRRALLGTGVAAAGGLLLNAKVLGKGQEDDVVLDHAGREMLRMHQNLRRVSRSQSLTSAAATLRLLSIHPAVTAAQAEVQHLSVADLDPSRAVRVLLRTLRTKFGYTGSADDLLNLLDAPSTIGDPGLSPTLAAVKRGELPSQLHASADGLEMVAAGWDQGPTAGPVAGKAWSSPRLLLIQSPVNGNQLYAGFPPCMVLATIQVTIAFTVIIIGIASMGAAAVAAGSALPAILTGMGLGIQIIRWGAC